MGRRTSVLPFRGVLLGFSHQVTQANQLPFHHGPDLRHVRAHGEVEQTVQYHPLNGPLDLGQIGIFRRPGEDLPAKRVQDL